MDIDGILNSALQKVNIQTIRPNQEKVIRSYLCGKDVLFCSPTGSGKSLTFELSPFLFKAMGDTDTATVIVVSPLVALMKSQTEKCLSLGLRAVYLNEMNECKDTLDDSLVSTIEKLSVEDVRDGEADIIFTSPESILGKYRNLVTDLDKGHHLKAIFIDEAHCIPKFGVSKNKKKAPFRPFYSQLGELRSLTSVPMIALTATASLKTQAIILNKLGMQKCEKIIVSPNKENIKYWMCEASGRVVEDFSWLTSLLLAKGRDCPRMIIFFRRTHHIGELYSHLRYTLGKRAYIDYKEDGPNDDRNRLFDMFHSKTDEEVKESICTSYMDPNGIKRVVLVSTSFSMGLDIKGVDDVIHYGPADDVEDYIQETGRCGRNHDSQANAILIKYKRCLSGKGIIQPCMKQYCKDQSTCRRLQLIKHFDTVPSLVTPLHACCDRCASRCKCGCECLEECQCDNTCKGDTSLIMNSILSSHNSSCSSSSSSSRDSSRDSSDSDIESVRLHKRIVLLYSSESD